MNKTVSLTLLTISLCVALVGSAFADGPLFSKRDVQQMTKDCPRYSTIASNYRTKIIKKKVAVPLKDGKAEVQYIEVRGKDRHDRQIITSVNGRIVPNYQADELVRTANQTPVF